MKQNHAGLLDVTQDCLSSRLLLLALVPSPPSPTHPETHKTSYHQCHLPLHLLPTQAIQAALLGRVIMNSPRALFSFWRSSLSSLTPNTQLCNLKEDVSQETALLHSVRKTALKAKLLAEEKKFHLDSWEACSQIYTKHSSAVSHQEMLFQALYLCPAHSLPKP